MTTTATGTSLMLIALGAVLAFAVSFQVVGIDIVAIGVILMIVGIIGLAISILTIAGYAPWNRAGQANQMRGVAPPAAAGTPTQGAAPAQQAPTNSPQASVVVVGAPAPESAPVPAAAPATPAAPAAEVTPRG